MQEDNKIQLFENRRIRTAWDEEKEQTNLNNSSEDGAATGRSTVSYDLFF